MVKRWERERERGRERERERERECVCVCVCNERANDEKRASGYYSNCTCHVTMSDSRITLHSPRLPPPLISHFPYQICQPGEPIITSDDRLKKQTPTPVSLGNGIFVKPYAICLMIDTRSLATHHRTVVTAELKKWPLVKNRSRRNFGCCLSVALLISA